LCNVRLSTTPKAKSFVGTAEALTNVREDNEETEETKAQRQAVVMDLITKITKDTSLVMTAEIEEMVETLRAKVGIGIWDTGCRKTVAGATWIKTYVQALSGLGYFAEFAACTEKFKFGNQGTLACERCWYLPVMMYGKMGTLAVHEVAGDCPLLISEESMTRLGVVLRLRAKKIDIEDLEIAGEVLEFHPRSGHPIVRLLPTVKNPTAGAAYEEQFVGQIAIDMPESADSDSGLEEVHFVSMKKGVRRRFAGLYQRRDAGYPACEAAAEDLGGFHLDYGFVFGGGVTKLGRDGARHSGVRLGLEVVEGPSFGTGQRCARKA
jgi:hypothetical protein